MTGMRRGVRIVASGVAAVLGLGLVVCMSAPQALAFPVRQQFGDTIVYAEQPVSPAFVTVLQRSDRLLKASAIYGPGYGRRIFLTDGGWRWRLLSLQLAGSFAHTRAVSGAIIVNRSDIDRDLVITGRDIAGIRSLSGAIAHERTHGLIRARYGMFADLVHPNWMIEGYCDVVAGGGSLSDAQAARLQAIGRHVPAMAYYDGRKRVERILRAKGQSVDKLFAGRGEN